MYCSVLRFSVCVYAFTQCIDDYCCWQGNSAGGEPCLGCEWPVYAWLRSLYVHRLRAHYILCRSNASDTSQPAPVAHSSTQARISLVSRLPKQQRPNCCTNTVTFSLDLCCGLDAHAMLLLISAPIYRFIYAFGGAGLFLFLTAISGLYGACYSNRHCLNFYSTMIIVMLLAQCVLLVGYFADQSWKKRLPHDDTGEAAKVGACLCLYVLQVHAACNLQIS